MEAMELAAPTESTTLTIAGSTSITDASKAHLVAVLVNPHSEDMTAVLTARSSGGIDLRVSPPSSAPDWNAGQQTLEVEMPAKSVASAIVHARVTDAISRGSVAVVVSADVMDKAGVRRETLMAAQNLQASLSADALPTFFGVSGALLFPGTAMVYAYLAVLRWDQKRLRVTPTSIGARLWQDKELLALAALLSVGLAWVFSHVGLGSFFDTYTVPDLAIATALAAVLGALLALLRVAIHRRGTRLLTSVSSKLEVVQASETADPSNLRPVYKTSNDKRGVLIHVDRGIPVLAPRMGYMEIDVDQAAPKLPNNQPQRLSDITRHLAEDPIAKDDVRLVYLQSQDWVSHPGAAIDARPTGESDVLLRYSDS
ncbi:hypothetical protein [Ornithinimicrobium pekingense]|nr:hypothetical protein [Ornithinimicrobium pekingense]